MFSSTLGQSLRGLRRASNLFTTAPLAFLSASGLLDSRDVKCNETMQKFNGFRYLVAAALVSSHANGETSENQNRAGRKTPARASEEFTA
jgi:hypothetical protein